MQKTITELHEIAKALLSLKKFQNKEIEKFEYHPNLKNILNLGYVKGCDKMELAKDNLTKALYVKYVELGGEINKSYF